MTAPKTTTTSKFYFNEMLGFKIENIALEDNKIILNKRSHTLASWKKDDSGKTIFPHIRDGFLLCTVWTEILDVGQSCCEHRYMETDDDLQTYVGATIFGVSIRDVDTVSARGDDCAECQFLLLHTSKGDITIKNYNEHNGYYGGFSLVLRSMRMEEKQ